MTMSLVPPPDSIHVMKGIREGKVVSCISNTFGNFEDSQLIKVTYAIDDCLSINAEFALKQYKDD